MNTKKTGSSTRKTAYKIKTAPIQDGKSKKGVAKKGSSSKNTHKQPQVSRETSKSRRNPFPISSLCKKIMCVCVVICAAAVLMCVVVNSYYEASRVADRKIVELVKDYYENYYYDKIAESLKSGDISEDMQEALENGIEVKLRHLYLFDGQRDAGYEKYFDNTNYVCDKNSSVVMIYPVKPYERDDYRVEYNMSCQKL